MQTSNPISVIYASITKGTHQELAVALKSFPHLIFDEAGGIGSWMQLAAIEGKCAHMAVLIEAGLSVNHPSAYSPGVYALDSAIARNQLAAARWLLDHGADVKLSVPLIAAKTVEAVQLLLEYGADPSQRAGNPPRSGYEQAIMMGKTALIPLLAPKNAQFDILQHLIKCFGPMVDGLAPKLPAGAPFSLALFRTKTGLVLSTVGMTLHALPGIAHRSEVQVRLPPDWPDTLLLGTDPQWPVEYLLDIAGTALQTPILSALHTIGNGEPAQPLAKGTKLCGVIVVPEPEESVPTFDAQGNSICLFSLFPIYREEIQLAKKSIEKLVRKLDQKEISAYGIITMQRKNVATWF